MIKENVTFMDLPYYVWVEIKKDRIIPNYKTEGEEVTAFALKVIGINSVVGGYFVVFIHPYSGKVVSINDAFDDITILGVLDDDGAMLVRDTGENYDDDELDML